jgi:hypothetical protein
MQLRLFPEPAPPPNPTPTKPAPASWEQIDQAARLVALELLARLVAQMLAAQEKKGKSDE